MWEILHIHFRNRTFKMYIQESLALFEKRNKSLLWLLGAHLKIILKPDIMYSKIVLTTISTAFINRKWQNLINVKNSSPEHLYFHKMNTKKWFQRATKSRAKPSTSDMSHEQWRNEALLMDTMNHISDFDIWIFRIWINDLPYQHVLWDYLPVYSTQ